MFTGIIECIGVVKEIVRSGTNIDFWIASPITKELKIDQSVAHNGVCLTVVEIAGERYRVTAVDETLKKTNLAKLGVGSPMNIERALRIGDRLDGHFVQGHVDATGNCTRVEQLDGSWLYSFNFPEQFAALVIEKGSVCINGVSLTAFNISGNTMSVTIIPYTYANTTFGNIQQGDTVNLEFDVLGKYFLRREQVERQ